MKKKQAFMVTVETDCEGNVCGVMEAEDVKNTMARWLLNNRNIKEEEFTVEVEEIPEDKIDVLVW